MISEQLRGTFGEDATKFMEYNECIWREEPNNYTSSETPLQPHQNNGNPIFSTNQFDDRLLFSSTEVSPHFGGYMEGAVSIADTVAKKLKEYSVAI